MWAKRCKLLLSILLAITTIQASGQLKISSPYSRFGLGDIEGNTLFPIRAMGSLDASFHDPYYINLANPAALGFLRYTAFEVGVTARSDPIIQSDQRGL
jgi:hypothetical protein